jgi:hypothetical protein
MRKATVGRCEDGESDGAGDCNWLVGTSTSTEPTLCGPVYGGNSGVGFNFPSQVMLATLADLDFARARRDLEMRKSDSVSDDLRYQWND